MSVSQHTAPETSRPVIALRIVGVQVSYGGPFPPRKVNILHYGKLLSIGPVILSCLRGFIGHLRHPGQLFGGIDFINPVSGHDLYGQINPVFRRSLWYSERMHGHKHTNRNGPCHDSCCCSFPLIQSALLFSLFIWHVLPVSAFEIQRAAGHFH